MEAVILRGLEGGEQRFATPAEMRDALHEAVGMKRPSSSTNQRASNAVATDAWAVTGVATPASTPAQAAATNPGSSSHPSVHGELAAQPAGGKRAGVIVAAFALTAALAGGAWVVFGKKGDTAAVLPPAQVEAKPPSPTTEPPKPQPPPPIAQPVAAPIPPAPEHPPPTVLAQAAHAHKKHEPHSAPLAATKPAAAAPAAAAAASPDVAPAKPSTAPKGALAEGQALLRGGDVDGALAKFQEAARANPSDAKAQKEIGKCYNRLGQRDRAQPYLKKYLESSISTILTPNPDGKRSASGVPDWTMRTTMALNSTAWS